MPRRDDPHPMGLAVGQRIAQLRAEQGMNLGQFALASGVSKGHLSNIEHGLAVITVATLETLARGLGVETFYLLVFPEKSVRDQYVEKLRAFNDKELRALLGRMNPRRRRRPRDR